jgi:branched-chain amino acid transport system substrate-binding protein
MHINSNKAVVIGVLCWSTASMAFAQEQIVKVGLTGPLAGAQAPAGKDNENGVRLAINQLNQSGLVIGGKKVKFELISEDDQADPKSGVSAVQKLVDSRVAAILGPYNSGVAIPASRLANDAGIPMLTTGSNPKITKQGYPFVFRIAASDNTLGGRMGQYAAKDLKLKKVAVVDDRTAYGQGVAEQFVKSAKQSGIAIATQQYTNDKAADFMSILTAIKATNADAIFFGGYFPQGGPLRRQMKQLGMNGMYLLGGDSICSAELSKLGGEAVDDKVYCTQGGVILEADDAGKRFSQHYEKQYGAKPLTYAVSFYDGMMLLAQAMKKAESVQPEKFHKALQDISYKGVAGSYEFDKDRDLKNSPVTIYRFKNGEPAPIGGL